MTCPTGEKTISSAGLGWVKSFSMFSHAVIAPEEFE